MKMLQLLDTDGNLIGDMVEWISSIANVEKCGVNYNVVAILGAQSSGKSTLLNSLFDTSFPVMNARLGHHRTTTGIWLSLSNTYAVPTVIIDVEGTDSKEKEDNYMTFEHRVALFSLAVADCLIINFWYNNLGNSIASNFSLLKTVLEANMALFHCDGTRNSKTSKPALIFVIRDWLPSVTPMESLKKELYEYHIQKIWSKVQKPASMENEGIDQFFNIRVFGLSHRLLDSASFKKDISNLKLAWDRDIRPPCCTHLLPLDSFGSYCLSVWDTIMQQQQLDIPSLKEMVSVFRCQEIKQNLLNEAMPAIKEKRSISHYETLENFINWTKDVILSILEQFQALTIHYHSTCVAQVQEELLHSLLIETQDVADNHFIQLRLRLAKVFQEGFNKFCGRIPEIIQTKQVLQKPMRDDILKKWTSFSSVSQSFIDSILKQYDTEVQECVVNLFECTHVFDSSKQRDALIGDINLCIQSIRERQIIAFRAFLQMEFKESFGFITTYLKDSTLKGIKPLIFWDRMEDEFLSIETSVDKTISLAWKSLISEDAEVADEKFSTILQTEILSQFFLAMTGMNDTLPLIIFECFRHFFDFDSHSCPREWKTLPNSALEALFTEARTKAIAILDIFLHVDLKIPKTWTIDVSLLKEFQTPFLNETDEQNIRTDCMERMQDRYKLILGIRDRNPSWSQIPFYFWIILLFFAWNEILGVLSFAFSTWPIIFISLVGILFWYMSSANTAPNDSPGGVGNYAHYLSAAIRFFSYLSSIARSIGNSLNAVIAEHPAAATGQRVY